MSHGFVVFGTSLVIGVLIDESFRKMQKQLRVEKSCLLGFLQLFVVLSVSYFLHISTSNAFSKDYQIYSPSVLFSSLIFGLQKNMLGNFFLM
uniref:EamA domain-containing protein n=1 Tax=viral metagenome TaxID=1070528 RepID=A0A6C0E0C2_9ZZZZ